MIGVMATYALSDILHHVHAGSDHEQGNQKDEDDEEKDANH